MERYVINSPAERLAIGLGCFSLALGAAELFAPRRMARLVGVSEDRRTRSTLRAIGAREITSGLAVLSKLDQPWPVWSRVGGDALDLALLMSAMGRQRTDRGRVALAATAVLGVTALDWRCARQLSRAENRFARYPRGTAFIQQSVTINRPLTDVFAFWMNVQNFPIFMRHIESVVPTEGGRTRWRAKAPAGMVVEWEAEVVGRAENEWITWRSISGSDISHNGTVRFEHAPGARGTEVHVELQYSPPAGVLGMSIAKLFGREPEQQIKEDLRRLKQLMEAGEIPVSDGPGLKRPARPPARREDILSLVGVTE